MDIQVVDILDAYGMLLSRDWSWSLNGYMATDFLHMWLPWRGVANQIRVDREPQMAHLVTEYNVKNEHVSYASVEIGIYTLTITTTKNEGGYARMNPDALWTLYVDGSRSKHGAGAGIALVNPGGKCHTVAYHLKFPCTNNTAEYVALVLGLRFSLKHGVKNIRVYGDSELVINQVKSRF